MTAVYPGDGGGFNRPCVVAQGGSVLSGTAVAAGAGGLKQEIEVEGRDVNRLGVLRYRRAGASERLKTDLEGS